MRFLIFLLSVFSVLSVLPFARAAEPFLQKGDVIALVGGEDMVVAGELGHLELLLTRALPEHQLRFRCLAWEGDTVFEQRRDLNFPPLEAQLDQIGATVVICQFGQMEALAAAAQWKGTTENTESTEKEKDVSGKDASQPSVSSAPSVVQNPDAASAVEEFIAAYEKLIERMRAGGKRRVVLVSPAPFGPLGDILRPAPETSRAALSHEIEARRPVLQSFGAAIQAMAQRRNALWIDLGLFAAVDGEPRLALSTRDGVHLDDLSQSFAALTMARRLSPSEIARVVEDTAGPLLDSLPADGLAAPGSRFEQLATLAQLIRAKNRLWFDYWRVQNWAFLAGDRTAQPSSRDHLDRTKRWFPAEREAFLPLIAAKEKEIHALAAQLARP